MESPTSLAERYVAVWNETDTERRKEQIAELWIPNGRHNVSDREVEGYEALEERIRQSHQKNVIENRNQFRSVNDARHLQNANVFHWEMFPSKGENVLGRGLDFFIVDSTGKIVEDHMFFPA